MLVVTAMKVVDLPFLPYTLFPFPTALPNYHGIHFPALYPLFDFLDMVVACCGVNGRLSRFCKLEDEERKGVAKTRLAAAYESFPLLGVCQELLLQCSLGD